jgi:hypothetical protein
LIRSAVYRFNNNYKFIAFLNHCGHLVVCMVMMFCSMVAMS